MIPKISLFSETTRKIRVRLYLSLLLKTKSLSVRLFFRKMVTTCKLLGKFTKIPFNPETNLITKTVKKIIYPIINFLTGIEILKSYNEMHLSV